MRDMTNVNVEVEDGELVIRVNLNERHGPSSSGETTIVASTKGPLSLKDFDLPKLRATLTVYEKQ